MSNGWRLTGFLCVVLVCISVPILWIGGINEESIRMFLRTTARCSAILFLSAFSASSVVRLFPSRLTRWLAKNRRYIGVSFAFNHTLHLIGILMLLRLKPHGFSNPAGMVTLIGGGTAFLLIFAMAATSFDRTAAWLGPRNWKRLHRTGVYFLWFIFFADYVPRAFKQPIPYAPFAVLVVGALFLRIAAWRLKRRRTSRGEVLNLEIEPR